MGLRMQFKLPRKACKSNWYEESGVWTKHGHCDNVTMWPSGPFWNCIAWKGFRSEFSPTKLCTTLDPHEASGALQVSAIRAFMWEWVLLGKFMKDGFTDLPVEQMHNERIKHTAWPWSLISISSIRSSKRRHLVCLSCISQRWVYCCKQPLLLSLQSLWNFAVQCTLAGLSATPIAITSRRDVSSKYLISPVTQDVRWKQMLVDTRVACTVWMDAWSPYMVLLPCTVNWINCCSHREISSQKRGYYVIFELIKL